MTDHYVDRVGRVICFVLGMDLIVCAYVGLSNQDTVPCLMSLVRHHYLPLLFSFGCWHKNPVMLLIAMMPVMTLIC